MKTITTHYIDGKFVESHGTELFDLVNPTNRTVIGRVTLGNEEDVRDAVRAAKQAFKTFSKSTLEERCRYLQQLHDAVAARADEHIALMTQEYGGVHQIARFAVDGAARIFLNMKQVLSDVPFVEHYGDARVLLKSIGVAGLITPWNVNTLMICQKLAPAVAAGCTTVIKPSEMSALQTQLLLECFDAAGLPKGVINLVNGRGEVVGNEITTHPDVAKISFTGSTAVGKTILRNAVETMKRVTLELGGKAPHIILDDADLEKAIPFAVTAGFLNSGQACVAGTRILVPENRLEDVKSAFKTAVANVKVGDPSDPEVFIGPMVSEKQYNRVQRYIRKGIEEGAEVLIGGEGHPAGLESGHFVKPTVFVNVTNDMTIAREEIFGPVVAIMTYKTEAEAIAIANDTPYGLQGWISTSNPKRGQEIAAQIEAGVMMINGFYDPFEVPKVPVGGVKQSGMGREFGVYGIEEYLETQSVFAG